MPIKGMTDQAAALPIVGILRKGEEKTDERKPGKDLTYFRFVTDDPLAQQMFDEAYPNQEALRNINVFLPCQAADQNFDAWIEKWVASSLIYRSDGETVVRWRTEAGAFSDERKPDPKPGEGEDGKRRDGSSQVGRLSVIVPELGRMVTVTVLTTSKWDVINLSKQLRMYESLTGDLRGIPFVLRRKLQKISTPAGNGKRARREKWLLSIETEPRWSMMQLTAQERRALPQVEIIDDEAEEDRPQLPETVSPFDEGDFEPAPPGVEAAREIAPTETNGNSSRPYPPEMVKAGLAEKVAKGNHRDPETGEFLPVKLHSQFGDRTPQLVAALFQTALTVDGADPKEVEKEYHSCLNWLTGKSSAGDLTAAEADAILYWLLGKERREDASLKTGDFFSQPVNEYAREEARQIHRAAMVDAGQLGFSGWPDKAEAPAREHYSEGA